MYAPAPDASKILFTVTGQGDKNSLHVNFRQLPVSPAYIFETRSEQILLPSLLVHNGMGSTIIE
ncbi:hypothetical protein E5D57_003265 [Metarhizium anisopliae]|nr:hypothetical protein E5D57_003265 [Metarhizium anisopliae]